MRQSSNPVSVRPPRDHVDPARELIAESFERQLKESKENLDEIQLELAQMSPPAADAALSERRRFERKQAMLQQQFFDDEDDDDEQAKVGNKKEVHAVKQLLFSAIIMAMTS